MIKAQQQELLIESAMEQFNGKVKLRITGEENFIVHTKMSKSLPEIFQFIAKNLLKTEIKNLTLNFGEKDLELKFEDLEKEEYVDMLLFHLAEKNYLADENGESEQIEGQIEEEETPEIKISYRIQRPESDILELEDSELIRMFSKYWGYLMFMKKSELPKDINILKKRESKALTKM